MSNSFENASPGGYLSKKQVREYLGGISSTTLHDWIKERGFPRPIYVSSQRPLWLRSEVEDFMRTISKGQEHCKRAMTNAELALFHLDRTRFHCNLSKDFITQHLTSKEAKLPGAETTALNEKLKRIRQELESTADRLRKTGGLNE